MSSNFSETDVLSDADLRATHEEKDWPVFTLHNVNVLDNNNKSSSLLEATISTPRTVIGQLRPLARRQSHLLISQSLRQAPYVELANVTRFRIDGKKGKTPRILALGQSGWYNIKPSEDYLKTWQRTTQELGLFSFIREAHLKVLRLQSEQRYEDVSVEQLFDEYAKRDESKGSDITLATLHEHSFVLLICMYTQESSGIQWRMTPLHSYMEEQYPADVHRAMALVYPNEVQSRLAQRLPTPESDYHEGSKRYKALNTQQPDRRNTRSRHTQEHPVTPKTSAVQFRHQYGTKGRSALRPSAVKPDVYERLRRSSNIQDMEDEDSQDVSGASRTLHQRIDLPQIERTESETEDSLDGSAEEEEGPDEIEDEDEERHSESDMNKSAEQKSYEKAQSKPIYAMHTSDPARSISDITWTCNVDGCYHKIIDTSTPDSQLIIEEHIALHQYDNDARVKLVKQLEHASLPAQHLMERVRLVARAEHLQ